MINTPRTRHTLIAGMGRCGTTLLVRLCAELGFSTVLDEEGSIYIDMIEAGLEAGPCPVTLPYIIKSPFAYEWLAKPDARPALKDLDFCILPVRDPIEAAFSRLTNEYMHLYSDAPSPHPNYGQIESGPPSSLGFTPGGYHYDLDPQHNARFLSFCLTSLIYLLSRNGVRLIFLPYPEFTGDANLTWKFMAPFLRFHGIDKQSLDSAIAKVVNPSKVHSYGAPPSEDPEIAALLGLLHSEGLCGATPPLTVASHKAIYRLYKMALSMKDG